ncbi:MAG: tetratricopeptide repeat protein [Methanomicrobiales archaeon]
MNPSLDMLNKSLSIDPYSVRVWMIKGVVLSAMGRYIGAAGAYSQVLLLDPSDGVAAAKRGDTLNAGDYADAVASYDRAMAANPGYSGIPSNRILANQLASGLIQGNNSGCWTCNFT